MRILHKNIRTTKIIFHPLMSVVYIAVLFYFAYSNYKLFPMWEAVQMRLEKSKEIYEKKVAKKQSLDNEQALAATDEGQKRYRKEFFNELDDGEKLIILYNDGEIPQKNTEQLRKLSTLEKIKQKIKLWWANF